MILARLVIGVAFVSSILGCIDNGSKNDDSGKINLSPIESDKQFKQSFMQPFLTLYDPDDCQECVWITSVPASEDSSSVEFSDTNLQVKAVDESDVWKYDGENFFVLNPARWVYQNNSTVTCSSTLSCAPNGEIVPASIRIINNTHETLATIDLGEQSGSELFLNNDQLIMIYKGQSYYGRSDNKASIRSWDVSNHSAPQNQYDVEVDGYIQRTRRIGDELYVVSRFSPRIEGLIAYPRTRNDIVSNEAVLNRLEVNDILPKITINGEEKTLVDAADCLAVNVPQSYHYNYAITTITRFNTKTNVFNSRCVLGPADGIHMSEDNLYVYANSYYAFDLEDDGAVTWDWAQGNNHIHQFALAQGGFDYQGSALLPGMSGGGDANFRYGELEDGNLAVVTSTNHWQNPQHLLTVLKSNGSQLEIVSQLPNASRPQVIGKPGERIYSVRFMQNRAYIVTFKKTDPLYVIDLSDAQDPRIAGELEIPGFSEYLHPVNDELLIGIGKNVETDTSGNIWNQGIKVALFDVSDMSNPTELSEINIGQHGSHTALSYEHHAFTGLQVADQYRFAFPISVNDGASSDSPSQPANWSYTGLHLFEIENKQLTLKGAMITDRNEDDQEYNYWNTRRGLIQGEDVYHLSGGDIYQANWAAPSDISEKF